jgi:hypothetical protein
MTVALGPHRGRGFAAGRPVGRASQSPTRLEVQA